MSKKSIVAFLILVGANIADGFLPKIDDVVLGDVRTFFVIAICVATMCVAARGMNELYGDDTDRHSDERSTPTMP